MIDEDIKALLLVILFLLSVILCITFLVKENALDRDDKDVYCIQEDNLSFSYFNKTTLEITTVYSKIPIYINCENGKE